MTRVVVAVVAAAALLALPACGTKASGGRVVVPPTQATGAGSSSGASAGASGGPSASPSASTVVAEFSVDGAGPYQLGAKLDDLKTTPGLADLTSGKPPCPQDTVARGTGVWKDLSLSFHNDSGELYLVVNNSASVPTPSGAWLGTPLAQLKKIYSQIQTQDLTSGSQKAFLVTTLSGRGILFELNSRGTVTAMKAGDATFLQAAYRRGAGFC